MQENKFEQKGKSWSHPVHLYTHAHWKYGIWNLLSAFKVTSPFVTEQKLNVWIAQGSESEGVMRSGGRVCADCQVVWLIDYEARVCHCNYLISCPFGARHSTNLDPFLLQAAHASVLLDVFRHLNATISAVTPALTYHGNFFLASITGRPRSLLPFLAFQSSNQKHSGLEDSSSPLLPLRVPSSLPWKTKWLWCLFLFFSLRAGSPGRWQAGHSLNSFPIFRSENFPLSWEWEPFLSSPSVAAFFLSRALGQLSNYESTGKIFKRPKWDSKPTVCQVAGL